MKHFIRALCTLLLANFAWADYHGDLSVSHLSGSTDSGYDIPEYQPPVGDPGYPMDPVEEPRSYSEEGDYNGWSVDGTYYLQSVDTSLGPKKLAPFLSRASSIGGGVGRVEYDDSDSETEFWDVFGRFIVNERWVIEGGFGGVDERTSVLDTEVDIVQAAVGLYFATDSQLRIGFDREEADIGKSDRWSVDVVTVKQLENGHTVHANLLFGLVTGDDDGEDIDLALSYFPNQAFGFGVDFSKFSRDQAGDTDAYKVWASYFVTEKISLELNFYKQERDNGLTTDSDGVEFEAKYRF